jgi:type III secretion apparatus needle protein
MAYDSSQTALPSYSPTASVGVAPALNVFTTNINASGAALQTAIGDAGANPNDPTNLIKMQAAMATYNTSLMVASSVVKSIEETAKSLTQKL